MEETKSGWGVSLTKTIEWIARVAQWRQLRYGIKWNGKVELDCMVDGREVATHKSEVVFGVVCTTCCFAHLIHTLLETFKSRWESTK